MLLGEVCWFFVNFVFGMVGFLGVVGCFFIIIELICLVFEILVKKFVCFFGLIGVISLLICGGLVLLLIFVV